MAGPYSITNPVQGQPISSSGFGIGVKNAINDLDSRTGALESGSQLVTKRGHRTTNTGNITTTETPILRLDDCPVRAGTIIQVSSSPLNLDTSVANDIASVKIRYKYSTVTGVPATIADGYMGQMRLSIPDITNGPLVPLNMFYYAGADGFLSILLTAVRVSGTGNIVIVGASFDPIDMVIQDLGVDPGATGVNL